MGCGDQICILLYDNLQRLRLQLHYLQESHKRIHHAGNAFGSVGSDTAMATDLVNAEGLSTSSGPYVSVEGKAAALDAELRLTPKCSCDCGCGCDDSVVEVPTAVCVTIGLFCCNKTFPSCEYARSQLWMLYSQRLHSDRKHGERMRFLQQPLLPFGYVLPAHAQRT